MLANSCIEYHLALMDSEVLGLPTNNIVEVVPVPQITKLPHTADYLLGVIKVKGNIIPVIDLKKKLTGISTEMTENCSIIMMEINYSQVGLVVETMAGIADSSSPLESLENVDSKIPNDYLLGVTSTDDKIIKVINCDALLR